LRDFSTGTLPRVRSKFWLMSVPGHSRHVEHAACTSGLLLKSDVKENLQRNFTRPQARFGTSACIEPFSCDIKPSLWRHNADIGTWRPETIVTTPILSGLHYQYARI